MHTVTDARRPMSEDINYRERRYLISMGIRTVCFILAIVLVAVADGHLKWLAGVALVGAALLPYIAVIFANGGREPESGARFKPYEPPEQRRTQIPGEARQISSGQSLD